MLFSIDDKLCKQHNIFKKVNTFQGCEYLLLLVKIITCITGINLTLKGYSLLLISYININKTNI